MPDKFSNFEIILVLYTHNIYTFILFNMNKKQI